MIVGSSCIQQATTRAATPRQAVRELCETLGATQNELGIVFVSPRYDREAFAAELHRYLPGTPWVGCTTAGEIAPSGYADDSAVAIVLPSEHFRVVVEPIEDLAHFSTQSGRQVAGTALARLRTRGIAPSPTNTFALLLIDGLSVREEFVVSSISAALGEIPLFGGSAGDALQFRETAVLCNGAFARDRAVLVLIQTDLPFRVFKTQHFIPANQKLVVTGADAERRVVTEINGEIARDEYARLVGVSPEDLSPAVFAKNPVVVRVGGDTFVRSISRANPDGSLTFFCAIEEGVVLSLATGGNLVANLEAAFVEVSRVVGAPELILGCDCILRKLEIDRDGLRDAVGELFHRFHVVGFATYGEQIDSVHVNQTFTGVAIGVKRADGTGPDAA